MTPPQTATSSDDATPADDRVNSISLTTFRKANHVTCYSKRILATVLAVAAACFAINAFSLQQVLEQDSQAAPAWRYSNLENNNQDERALKGGMMGMMGMMGKKKGNKIFERMGSKSMMSSSGSGSTKGPRSTKGPGSTKGPRSTKGPGSTKGPRSTKGPKSEKSKKSKMGKMGKKMGKDMGGKEMGGKEMGGKTMGEKMGKMGMRRV
jgi:hypothetical protein